MQYNHDRLIIVKRRLKKYSLKLVTERHQRYTNLRAQNKYSKMLVCLENSIIKSVSVKPSHNEVVATESRYSWYSHATIYKENNIRSTLHSSSNMSCRTLFSFVLMPSIELSSVVQHISANNWQLDFWNSSLSECHKNPSVLSRVHTLMAQHPLMATQPRHVSFLQLRPITLNTCMLPE